MKRRKRKENCIWRAYSMQHIKKLCILFSLYFILCGNNISGMQKAAIHYSPKKNYLLREYSNGTFEVFKQGKSITWNNKPNQTASIEKWFISPCENFIGIGFNDLQILFLKWNQQNAKMEQIFCQQFSTKVAHWAIQENIVALHFKNGEFKLFDIQKTSNASPYWTATEIFNKKIKIKVINFAVSQNKTLVALLLPKDKICVLENNNIILSITQKYTERLIIQNDKTICIHSRWIYKSRREERHIIYDIQKKQRIYTTNDLAYQILGWNLKTPYLLIYRKNNNITIYDTINKKYLFYHQFEIPFYDWAISDDKQTILFFFADNTVKIFPRQTKKERLSIDLPDKVKKWNMATDKKSITFTLENGKTQQVQLPATYNVFNGYLCGKEISVTLNQQNHPTITFCFFSNETEYELNQSFDSCNTSSMGLFYLITQQAHTKKITAWKASGEILFSKTFHKDDAIPKKALISNRSTKNYILIQLQKPHGQKEIRLFDMDTNKELFRKTNINVASFNLGLFRPTNTYLIEIAPKQGKNITYDITGRHVLLQDYLNDVIAILDAPKRIIIYNKNQRPYFYTFDTDATIFPITITPHCFSFILQRNHTKTLVVLDLQTQTEFFKVINNSLRPKDISSIKIDPTKQFITINNYHELIIYDKTTKQILFQKKYPQSIQYSHIYNNHLLIHLGNDEVKILKLCKRQLSQEIVKTVIKNYIEKFQTTNQLITLNIKGKSPRHFDLHTGIEVTTGNQPPPGQASRKKPFRRRDNSSQAQKNKLTPGPLLRSGRKQRQKTVNRQQRTGNKRPRGEALFTPLSTNKQTSSYSTLHNINANEYEKKNKKRKLYMEDL